MLDKMLVLDDEESILMALSDYFRKDYQVDTASHRKDAENLINKEDYSIAIVDLSLSNEPDQNGLDFICHMRKRSPSTKIIVLTAYGTTESEKKAYNLGVSHFLNKPVPLSELAKIASGLRSREVRP